jgi:hypothetical protein
MIYKARCIYKTDTKKGGEIMTLEDLKQMPLLQTRTIAEACKKDERTHKYIVECLQRFYAGDYGEICAEDTGYNNDDLASGYGHVLARYKGKFALEGDFYIEAHFDADHLQDVDYTQIMIMYPRER